MATGISLPVLLHVAITYWCASYTMLAGANPNRPTDTCIWGKMGLDVPNISADGWGRAHSADGCWTLVSCISCSVELVDALSARVVPLFAFRSAWQFTRTSSGRTWDDEVCVRVRY